MREDDPMEKIWRHLSDSAKIRHDEMGKIWGNLDELAKWDVAAENRLKRIERNLAIITVAVLVNAIAILVVWWVK